MQRTTEHPSGSGKLNRRLPGLVLLSLMIVIGIFWWLKLTGLTLSGEAFCGHEEHVHSEACLVKTLTCPLEEGAEHTHTDACYTWICSLGLEEHVHTALCYSDLSADVETADVWEASFADAVRTGEAGHDAAAIAETQLGYTESVRNYVLDEDGTRRGYTRYGDWYGNAHGSWSAMFAAFCLHYAGVTGDMAPFNAGTQTMLTAWKEQGLFCTAADDTPRAGDVVFLDGTESGVCTDVGIVLSVGEELTVVQGDSGDKVEKLVYTRTDPRILGYGSITAVIAGSLSERDAARVENVRSVIAALPTEEQVAAVIDGGAPDSEAFAQWYQELSLQVMTTYAYYEDLGPRLQILIDDTAKLDALNGIWQSSNLSNRVVTSLNVYQVNLYQNALTTVAYGGSVGSVIGTSMGFAYWTAVIVDKNDAGFYVSAVNRKSESKLTLAPGTAEGFVLLVWQGSPDHAYLADVQVGQSVSVLPDGFYRSASASVSDPVGTVTFTTEPVSGEGNESINRDKLSIVESADTDELIQVNLYDYGANINDKYLSDTTYPGFQQDGGTKNLSALGKYGMNFGNNITQDLKTLISNVTTNNAKPINKTVNSANSPLSGAMAPTLQDGYPALADGKSLQYLFSDNTYAKKQNVNNINGLFQHNEKTGAYTFNSRLNHAQFDPATDTFVLYQQLITSNFIMYPFGNFLPFNDIRSQTTQATTIDRAWFQKIAAKARYCYNTGVGDEYLTLYESLTTFISLMDKKYGAGKWDYDEAVQTYFSLNGIPYNLTSDYLATVYSIDYDQATDFFFGMDMHMQFLQPKNGLTGLDGQQKMVFDFIGDDDVWVYIDGRLFLDLSGIHRHVGGTIDFTAGVVSYYSLDPSTGQTFTAPDRQVTFAELLGSTDGLNEQGTFSDFSMHTLDFYYMERGAGSGVCEMNFNIPLVRENNISVTKELESADSGVLGNPDFTFQILREGGNEPLIEAGTAYTILDAHGNPTGTGCTEKNGLFRLKAGQTAIFESIPENAGRYFVRELFDPKVFEQYGQVTVDGSSITTDSYTDVPIDADTFKGVDSTVKDMSDGSTSFFFNNHVDAAKYGSLEICKIFQDYAADAGEKSCTFLLSIDGVPVPAGTAYAQIGPDGTVTEAVIVEEGRFTFLSGQTIRFPAILAGSSVKLTEAEESSDGYTVFYQGDNIRLTEDAAGGVSGVIGAGAASGITVTNDRNGTKLTVPAEKALLYPDGTEQTFAFVLREVISPGDLTPVAEGQCIRGTVTVTAADQPFSFVLNYPPESTADGKHYYRIDEENAVSANGADTDFYLVEVTTRLADGQVLAEITGILKNGTEPVETVRFVNRNVRSLTVKKTVAREEDCRLSFGFTIRASVGGVPLSGEFTAETAGGMTMLRFTDGEATVYLRDGESVTVRGLPYGTEWTVCEQKTPDYSTECGVDTAARAPGNIVSGTLTDNTETIFVNSREYVLPATGSFSAPLYGSIGGGLMLGALFGGWAGRRRKKRR